MIQQENQLGSRLQRDLVDPEHPDGQLVWRERLVWKARMPSSLPECQNSSHWLDWGEDQGVELHWSGQAGQRRG